jgi:electron transport complex protein RnfA
MEACDKMPKAMEGLPISLITAGLMAIAFLGFQGLLH